MAWTDEMVETLKKLWDEGVTTGEIGRRLGISKNSIVGKVHRLGLSGRPSPIKKKSDTPAKPAPKAKDKSSQTSAPAPKAKPAPVKEPSPAPKAEKPEPKPVEKPIERPVAKKSTVEIITPLPDEEDDIKLACSINIASTEPSKNGNLSLTELDNHTCRWPIGDPKDDNFHFCGKKVRLGQTYCEEHSAIAYVKPTKK